MQFAGIRGRIIKHQLKLAGEPGSQIKPVHAERTGEFVRDVGGLFTGVHIQGPGSGSRGGTLDHLKSIFNNGPDP